MTPVTVVRIFVFTLTFFVILVASDNPQTYEENRPAIWQLTSVSLTNASLFKDELALEARDSARALRRAIKPLRLERPLKAVRDRVTSRMTIFSSFARAQLSLDTTRTINTSGPC